MTKLDAPEHMGLQAARLALAGLSPRLSGLIRSIPDASRPAVGDWSAGDVAAHLTHVMQLEVAAVLGTAGSVFASTGVPEPKDLSGVAVMNRAALDRDPVRDLGVLADRIDEEVARLLEATSGAEREVPWLLGTRLALSAITSHLVSEMVVHGYDIARALSLPWRINRKDALVSIEGFYLPMASLLGSGIVADGAAPASCDLRLRGGGRYLLARSAAGMEVSSSTGRADLHVSADPSVLLLVMAGRLGRVAPVLRGSIVAWGRHPLRAFRMLDAIRAP